MARRKQALIGKFTGAVSTLGRVEIEATWQKDIRRPIKIILMPGDVRAVEAAIARFKIEANGAVPVRETPTELPTPPKGPRRFKTIADKK